MKFKILLFLFIILLATQVIPAQESTATITNFEIVQNISDFIAGDSTTSVFKFDYPGDLENDYNDAPLVVKINISSLNHHFPVAKGDFEIEMSAQKYWLFDLLPVGEPIPMRCKENPPIEFKPRERPGIQFVIDEVPDGVFYCYNANYYMLDLDSQTKITMTVSSHPAIYPGDYEVVLTLYEMEPDFEGPEIILAEPLGDIVIGGENEIIPVKLDISDLYNLNDDSVKYKIVDLGIPSEGGGINQTYYDSGWINLELNETSGLYEDEFNVTENGLNQSGSYWLYAKAEDVLGNEGEL
ncbi:hypothetical protein HY450_00320 [Candidatus Pacearchaeota archaeon]|nr:hypothetical protein [Candidatus Pacearchaeota archaeon]